MDNNTFMGLLIGALVVLFGLAGSIVAIVIKPIINLNRNMVQLDSSIQNLNKTANTMENRLNKHSQEIDAIKEEQSNQDKRIYMLEMKK